MQHSRADKRAFKQIINPFYQHNIYKQGVSLKKMKREISKKIFVFSILSLFVVSFFSFFVLAAAADTAEQVTVGIVRGIINAGGSFISPLFNSKELFTKLFFIILVWMIIYSLVQSLFKRSAVTTFVISGLISVLAVWFMPASLITTIRDQYGVMGASILSIIPFAIMVLFTVKIENKLIAQGLWIFWAFYYLGVYLYRAFVNLSADSFVYLGAAIAGVVIIFAVGPIRKLIFHGELGAMKETVEKDIEFRGLGRKLEREETKARLKTG